MNVDFRGKATTFPFILTSFLSAFLLFLIQPMAAKWLLPSFGGTPAVWTLSMLFFQVVLLAGYTYAHLLASNVPLRGQFAIHLGLLGVAILGLAPTFANRLDPDLSTMWTTSVALLGSLATTIGLFFFLLASTAPILQSWFAQARLNNTRDPYFLYAASNLGSLTALLAYPLIVERRLTLEDQLTCWKWGISILLGGLAVSALQAGLSAIRNPESPPSIDNGGVEPGRSRLLIWVILAFIPSSLLLGVTTYLTTDLSSIPLLWIVPLSLYLITFILAFSNWNRPLKRISRRLYPYVLVAVALSLGFGLVKSYLLPLHLTGFFLAAMVCHGELADRRPKPSELTRFYLAISFGGMLGGVFNGVVAPWLFNTVAEYPLALVLAALVLAMPSSSGEVAVTKRTDFLLPALLGIITAAICGDIFGLAGSGLGAACTTFVAGFTLLIVSRNRRQPIRFALTVGALLTASHFAEGVNGRLLLQERSFFGVTRVTDVPEGPFHRLFHGSTLHGQQGFSDALRRVPLSYFSESGPIGDIFRVRRSMGAIPKVAVAGLGAGSLLTYANASDEWTVYEIDPTIVRIASDPRYFTYVANCEAKTLKTIVGDARLEIAKQADGEFSMIFLDAFSSDAIPMHLITREALSLYRRKSSEGGWILFNISNRYLDLIPVVGLLAEDAGMACRVRIDQQVTPQDKAVGKRGSIWALLARSESELGAIADDPRWFRPRSKAADSVWTDGYSEIFNHLRSALPAGSP